MPCGPPGTILSLAPFTNLAEGSAESLTQHSPAFRHEGRELALKQLSCTAAPAVSDDADIGSGKMSSSPFSTPSKMARATDSGDAFDMSRSRVISVSTGPGRTTCTLTPRPAKRARSDCDRENAAAFEIE